MTWLTLSVTNHKQCVCFLARKVMYCVGMAERRIVRVLGHTWIHYQFSVGVMRSRDLWAATSHLLIEMSSSFRQSKMVDR